MDNNRYCKYKVENTLWYFFQELKIRNESNNYFSIKYKIEQESQWLEEILIIEGEKIMGKQTNFPGEQITISLENIVDWLIIRNGRLLGGYTIRNYRDTLTDKEKIKFDYNFGVSIDYEEDYFMANFCTPEGCITKLEESYILNDINKIIECHDFIEEAKDTLREVGIDITKEIISETAELLKLSLIKNIQENGFPDFAETKRIFSKHISLSENNAIIEEVVIDKYKNKSHNRISTKKDSNNNWKVVKIEEFEG